MIASFVVAGQSLTDLWFRQSGVLDAFRTRFLARNPQYADVQFFDAAVGGTAMLKASAQASGDPASAARYFYDEASGADGPTLAALLPKLAKWANGRTVLGVIWDQGQADNGYVTTSARAATYATGLDHVLQRLMAVSGARTTYIEALGDRSFYKASLNGGMDLMHAIQQQFVADHAYARLATTTYDLPLMDSVHPTVAGSTIAAQRMADAIATGVFSPVARRAITAASGSVFVEIGMAETQALSAPASTAAFRLNGEMQAIAGVKVHARAGLVEVILAHPTGSGTLTYASAQWSFGLSDAAILRAGGPTGALPVQPFTFATTRTAVAVTVNSDGSVRTTGSGADDVLQGFRGHDAVAGGGGNDVIDGGAGNDVLSGGTGADTFVFRAGMGVDRITDFQPGVDRIAVLDIDLSALRIRAFGPGGSQVQDAHGDRLVVDHVTPAALAAALHGVDHIDGLVI